MAHDLRSPLTSLKGFSGMLVSKWDRFDDEQKLEFVQAISFDARRMGRIIGEVIDLARLEAGRVELKRTRTPVVEIARAAAESLSHLDEERRIEVDVPDDIVVNADRDRLELVLFNLLENALEFSTDGPVHVTGAADDDGITIEVRDSGPGIEVERRAEIFSGGPTSSGAGVGLYLGRGLVELHGGSLEVDGVPGGGSRFTVRLPPEANDDE